MFKIVIFLRWKFKNSVLGLRPPREYTGDGILDIDEKNPPEVTLSTDDPLAKWPDCDHLKIPKSGLDDGDELKTFHGLVIDEVSWSHGIHWTNLSNARVSVSKFKEMLKAKHDAGQTQCLIRINTECAWQTPWGRAQFGIPEQGQQQTAAQLRAAEQHHAIHPLPRARENETDLEMAQRLQDEYDAREREQAQQHQQQVPLSGLGGGLGGLFAASGNGGQGEHGGGLGGLGGGLPGMQPSGVQQNRSAPRSSNVTPDFLTEFLRSNAPAAARQHVPRPVLAERVPLPVPYPAQHGHHFTHRSYPLNGRNPHCIQLSCDRFINPDDGVIRPHSLFIRQLRYDVSQGIWVFRILTPGLDGVPPAPTGEETDITTIPANELLGLRFEGSISSLLPVHRYGSEDTGITVHFDQDHHDWLERIQNESIEQDRKNTAPPEAQQLDLLRTMEQGCDYADTKASALRAECNALGLDTNGFHEKSEYINALQTYNKEAAGLVGSAFQDHKEEPCTICFSDKATVVLPCGHAYCAECNEGAMKHAKNGVFSCAVCRAETTKYYTITEDHDFESLKQDPERKAQFDKMVQQEKDKATKEAEVRARVRVDALRAAAASSSRVTPAPAPPQPSTSAGPIPTLLRQNSENFPSASPQSFASVRDPAQRQRFSNAAARQQTQQIGVVDQLIRQYAARNAAVSAEEERQHQHNAELLEAQRRILAEEQAQQQEEIMRFHAHSVAQQRADLQRQALLRQQADRQHSAMMQRMAEDQRRAEDQREAEKKRNEAALRSQMQAQRMQAAERAQQQAQATRLMEEESSRLLEEQTRGHQEQMRRMQEQSRRDLQQMYAGASSSYDWDLDHARQQEMRRMDEQHEEEMRRLDEQSRRDLEQMYAGTSASYGGLPDLNDYLSDSDLPDVDSYLPGSFSSFSSSRPRTRTRAGGYSTPYTARYSAAPPASPEDIRRRTAEAADRRAAESQKQDDGAPDFDKMSVKQLKKYCKDNGIDVANFLEKKDFVGVAKKFWESKHLNKVEKKCDENGIEYVD